MKIKFTLRRPGAANVDLVAQADADTTVGDLAAEFARLDPMATGAATDGAEPTLFIAEGTDLALDSRVKLADSGLRSGMTIGVTRAATSYRSSHGEVMAVVRVTAGPDAGREFALHSQSELVGRDPSCAVQLTDSLVSRQHARINIGSTAQIVDLASANGIEVGGSPVTRASLRPGDRVRLGDTELTVQVLRSAPTVSESTAVGFVRSPRLDPRYEGTKLIAPEPPQRPQPPRFPIIALVTPILMGGVLYLITRSVISLVFVALSPLMMIGYAVEATLAGRSAFKKALRQFRADVAELAEEARQATEIEIAARNAEHPSLGECVDAIRRGTPLLWTRRPDDPGFGELRLGAGKQPARNSIALPDGRHLPRDLMAELNALMTAFSSVDPVPVVARAAEHGSIGLAGPRETLLAAARALIVQLVAVHSPAELMLAAFVSRHSSADWDWLKWLPHTSSPHSPVHQLHLVSGIEDGVVLVSDLEELVALRAAKEAEPSPAVFILVEDDTVVERSRLVELADHGWQHGVHVIWLATEVARLPAACRSYVSLTHSTSVAAAGFVHSGESVQPMTTELLDAATATDLARRLSPLVDVGARLDKSDLPRGVSLLSVSERPLRPTPEVIVERWQENRSIVSGPYAPAKLPKKSGTLRAVVGRSALGAHVLDLRADGPHALVGGTTGSGKSELLQTWIIAMASAHSPQRLTFLLIDYKGGSAFKDLVGLPHQVGLVTDLDPHEVRRSLISLTAELKRREMLFAQYQVKDLLELEKKRIADAPPSLVIVVDEFAALVSELPEFVDGMVNVAQRGRSLGVHLILATQRPAGVIKDSLRANTNLRVALRTADEEGSIDVLGSAQAAFFDSSVPGRAVSKTGPGRLAFFQTGYAGGWTGDEPPPPVIVVEELGFGPRNVWEVEEDESVPVDLGKTDIQRLVDAVGGARVLARIRRPTTPWLPPLKEIYDLSNPEEVQNGRRDTELVFGIQDIPEKQEQPTVAFRPDVDGNLAVYGTGGSGKTMLLRTIAIAAGWTIRGGPCQVYGMDFGARGLSMLEELPHVGSIIPGAEHERIARLLNQLSDTIVSRADRFAKAGAGTITEYRARPDGNPTEPRILLLLDGILAFRQAYETGERSKLFDAFCTIATDGRPVGVHVLLTADRQASVPSALASAVQTRVVLRMADPSDYQGMNLPSDVIKPTSPPGRGMLQSIELQVAILGNRADVRSQVEYVRELAGVMTRNGVPQAPAIEQLSETALHALPATRDGLPVIGVAASTLEPQPFQPEGTFVVAGPPQSGRSNAVRALAIALRRWQPQISLYLFSPNKRSALAGPGLWTEVTLGHESAAKRAKELLDRVGTGTPMAIFLENVGDLAAGAADIALTDLVKACREEEQFVVAEGETTTLAGNMGLLGQIKSSRYGLAFAPDPADGERIFRTPFPHRLSRADFPAGRALLVSDGRSSVVQVGLVREGGTDPA